MPIMVSHSTTSKKVCVIGAGPAGIVAARELSQEGHSVVVLEQNHDIGGQWLYEPKVESEDPLGRSKFLEVHSSIYASLRLISPREIMGYTDFPFVVKKDGDMRRFPGHREVWLYLNDFCDYFGLRDMIRFNTRVEYVGMLDHSESLKWVVNSIERNSNEKNMVKEVFDAVVVATGHYSHPKLPYIKGMDTWKRKQIHSHIYRLPELFRDEVVVVVGSSNTAQDLAIELPEVAKEVHISYRSTNNITEGFSKVISKRDNLHLHPQIEFLEEDGRVVFIDGSWVIADTIVYCTGYTYTFPFLDTKGIVVVDDDRVGPLYEHTFPPSLAPSLSFVGIPKKIIGFPFFESQAKWIAELLAGRRSLPSREDMMQSIKEFYQLREAAGIPKHNTHDIGDFEEMDRISDLIGFPRLEKWRKNLCISAIVNMLANLETYRDSWDDRELLQEAFQSAHFTQYGTRHL